MGRSAELEGVDDEAEFILSFLRSDSENFEHPLLDVGVVDPDGTASEFVAVQHEVVSIGADPLEVFFLVAVEPVHMLRLRGGERMVHGIEAAVLLAPLEQREVYDPERCEHLRIPEAEPAAHLETQDAQHGLDLTLLGAAHYEYYVACLGLGNLGDGLELLGGVELVDRRLDGSVGIELYVDQAFGADLGPLDPFRDLVDLLAGVFGSAGHCDRADIGGVIEDGKTVALYLVGNLVDGHPKTNVGLVGTVLVHRVVPAHPGQRVGNVYSDDILEQGPHHALEHIQDILLLHEAHLAVDLCELRLTVSAKVLVPEAAHDLEVAVVAGNHKELLEGLWRLGKGVELAGVHPGRDHEVAGSFRSGLDQIRGLDLHETF